jgi:non-haem Fe2+, alpha-ketoglutarate-dependent halogenase
MIMPTKLSKAQVESYERDGFVSPVEALTREQATVCRGKLETFERAVGGPLTSEATDRYRSRTHVLLTWVHALARHTAILDAVEDLYTSTWFIKEPESVAIAAWHQDATYFGLRPYVHVTAWLALTDATAENGCMEFLPGSHRGGQRPHRAGVVAGSVNRAGQAVVGNVDDGPAVHAPLSAGEFSLHHTLCLHRATSRRTLGIWA